MPFKDGTPTRQETDFLDALQVCDSPEEAAKRANISQATFYRYMSHPLMRQEVDKIERAKLGEIVRKGNAWALKIMDDTSKPDTIKRDIWREANRLYYGPDGIGERQKEPHEMSVDELEAATRQLLEQRERIANQARDVTPPEPSGDVFD